MFAEEHLDVPFAALKKFFKGYKNESSLRHLIGSLFVVII